MDSDIIEIYLAVADTSANMIRRLWTTLRYSVTREGSSDRSVDSCFECGNPSLPAARRCVDCVEN
jgi:hypothetical protein